MPIPNPGEKENRETFMNRCLSDSVMNKEYKDTNQRYAICASQWREKSKTRDFTDPKENDLIPI